MATTGSNPEREIFEAALEIAAPAERDAYLRRACGEDESLLHRVRALLQADESAGGFLPDHPGLQPTLRAEVVAGEASGQTIGRYKLLEQIGEGGFGIVYMAEQTEPVKRRVALKVIKPGMDSRQVIGRFEAERQALALMDHPHIAQVFDAGATGAGLPYFVMELVKGIPITTFCRERALDLAGRLNLFLDCCGAVQHAHQKGIIHRDLKPSNLLVTLHGDKPVVKVIDFGIAKAIAQPLTDKTVFTQFQQFMGTPAYMSPEQAALSGLDVDTRSDVYSLGVLLYELLTGGPPFDSKELLSAGLDGMRRMICEQEPARPSTRLTQSRTESRTRSPAEAAAGTHLSAFASDLDWITMKALEKNRARRYGSAEDLAREIQRYLADEPVLARPPSLTYRVQKFVRRNRALVVGGTAIAGLLIVATAVSSTLALRLNRANRQVTLESETSADMLGFFTHDLIGQEGRPREEIRDLTLRAAVAQASATLGDRFPDRPDIERRIRIQLGDILRSLDDERQAREEYRKALALPAVGGPDLASKDRVMLLRSIAQCSFALQDFETAVGALQEAQAIAGAAIHPGEGLDVWLQMTEALTPASVDPQMAAENVAAKLEGWKGSRPYEGARPSYLGTVVITHVEFQQYEAALAAVRDLLHDEYWPMKPLESSTLGPYIFLAQIRCAMKDVDGARSLMDEITRLHAQSQSDAPEPSPLLLRIQGMIRTEEGDLQAGEDALRQALAVPITGSHERIREHHRILSMMPLARNLVRQDRSAEAEELVQEGLALAEQSVWRKGDESLVVRTAIDVAAAQGKWREALAYGLLDPAHPATSAQSLLLRRFLGPPDAFIAERRQALQAAADSDDRLVLSALLRAAALRPAESDAPYLPLISTFMDRLQDRLADSSPALQDETHLALAAAARLNGDGSALLANAAAVSDMDPLLHAQAQMVAGLGRLLLDDRSRATESLQSGERRYPLLTDHPPNPPGHRWADHLHARLLRDELHTGLADTKQAEAEPGPDLAPIAAGSP